MVFNGKSKAPTRCLALMLTLIMLLSIISPKAMAADTANYTVEHWLQELDGTYVIDNSKTTTPSGTVGDIVAASAETYVGFAAKTLPAAVLKSGGSTVLKVYYERNQYAVYFDANGGEYIEPYSALYGETVALPVNPPVRAGYNFAGWTITCDDNNTYTSGSFPMAMPAGDLHLTANWMPDTGNSQYTIRYWLEDPDNPGNYEYYSSEIVTGATAEDYITNTALDSYAAGVLTGSLSGYSDYLTYDKTATYAELYDSGTGTYTKATIAGDGTTIVNVYYDWNTYTLVFSGASYGAAYFPNEYSSNPVEITAKYGADISGQWPDSSSYTYSTYSFLAWESYCSSFGDYLYYPYADGMVLDDAMIKDVSGNTPNVIYARFTSNSLYTFNTHKMLQHLIDDVPSAADLTLTSSYLQIDGTDDIDGSAYHSFDTPKGFTLIGNGYTSDPTVLYTGTYYDQGFILVLYKNTTDVYSFYSRNSYKITFINGTGSATSGSIPYEAGISALGAEPARPAGIDNDYTFGGWYTSEVYDTLFDFRDATMPAGNLSLYAKWIKPEYTVTFNYANGDADTDQTVEKYETVSDPAPTWAGYTFGGWHKLNDITGELARLSYVFDFPVTSDFTLVAKWTKNFVIRVEIEDENGKNIGELPVGGGTLTVPGEVDDEGKPIIDDPYDLEGYGVYEIIPDPDGVVDYIVIYRPVSDPPPINSIYEGDGTVSGTGVPNSEITVTFPYDTNGDGENETVTTIVDKNGNWSVLVPDGITLLENDNVTAIQTEPGKLVSVPEDEIVQKHTGSVEKSKTPPIKTIYEGDKTVSGTGVSDSVIVVTFPDGSKVTTVVGKNGSWTVAVPDGVTLTRDDVLTATQTEQGKTVSDPSEKTVIYSTGGGSSGGSTPSPTPSPSPKPEDEVKTSDGHVIGGGSGRDSGNQYDTIVVIGEGDVPLASLIDDDHIKYLNGYPDGSVRAESEITRGEAASIFYRLMTNTHLDGTASTTFSDVPSDSWYSLAINTLAELDVITGYPDGTFRPDEPITRAEFAAIASRFDRLIITTGTAFSDVSEDHWAVSYINSAYVKGWVDGYPDYSFKPEQSISRAEVVKTVNSMLGRNPETLPDDINPYNDITDSHWAYIDILEASIPHDYERGENWIEYWTE